MRRSPIPLDAATQRHARRVFEETLIAAQAKYQPPEDLMVEATMPNAHGEVVVVARYKLYRDGRVECFEVLDEVLWPSR
jgi:hypothetical protein